LKIILEKYTRPPFSEQDIGVGQSFVGNNRIMSDIDRIIPADTIEIMILNKRRNVKT